MGKLWLDAVNKTNVNKEWNDIDKNQTVKVLNRFGTYLDGIGVSTNFDQVVELISEEPENDVTNVNK